MSDDKVIIVAGGDAVYVFRPDQAETAATQQTVIDVAYPADESMMRTVTAEEWDRAKARLAEANPEIEVVDLRES